MAKGKYEKWIAEDGLTLLEGWARDGLTDEQIAKNCGINVTTLYKWQTKYGQIRKALKKGKEVVDFEVENALLKRAMGYDYDEIKTEVDIDGKKKITKTRKHMPGDVTAMAIWLNNRKPDKYRRNYNKEQVDRERLEMDKKRNW